MNSTYSNYRGSDVCHPTPPAQIRTCSTPVYGSYLGCMASKRQLGNRAAWRTPVISWDMPVPCGVAYVGEGLAFSCVHALPSPLSAEGGRPCPGGCPVLLHGLTSRRRPWRSCAVVPSPPSLFHAGAQISQGFPVLVSEVSQRAWVRRLCGIG
jgi:hypothetical protein